MNSIIEELLREQVSLQKQILKELQKMDFTALQSSVDALTASVANASTELNALAGEVAAFASSSNSSAADQDTLNGFATKLSTLASNLQATVTADTPAAQSAPAAPATPASPPSTT